MLLLAAITVSSCTTVREVPPDGVEVVLAELRQQDEELKEAAVKLQEDWEAAKNEFNKRFSEAVGREDDHIRKLYLTLDGGSREVRDEINKQLGDHQRIQKVLNQKLTQLTAALAVKLYNVIGNTQKLIDNVKEELGAPPQL